jgi:two-component system OmpR family sensor kinase
MNWISASIRRQLAVGLTASIAVFWLLAILGAGLVVRHEIDQVFDAALQETAERILPLAILELIDRDDDGTSQRLARITEHEEFLQYVVRDTAGRVLLQSHDADLTVFTPQEQDGFHTAHDHRIFARSAVSGAYRIELAEPLAHRREAVLDTTLALLAPILLLVPISLFAVLWLVRRGLRPVEALRAEVTLRDGAHLSAVTTQDLPAEVLPIARAINQLLDRLRRTLEAERSFTANSAHELRTPIAATLAQTQRLIAEAPAGGLQDRARQIETQLRRLARLSEKLMQLARAEGGGVLADTPQDLSPVLAFLVDECRRAGGAARLQLALPPQGCAPSRLDPDAFGILARNLIENALRHGDPAQPVRVSMEPDGTLRVTNGGAIIAPDRLALLTTRFTRGDGAAEGSGLGLAIAAAIAKGAQTPLELHSPANGQKDGFEAVLRPVQPVML